MSRLLQLLTGYIRSEFDTMLAQADTNLLKVWMTPLLPLDKFDVPSCNQEGSVLQVVRFWAQWVSKLAIAFPEVSQGIWGSLAGCFAHIHSDVPPVR